ncbi:MAG: NADH-quinone oxidoreductase subunit L [Bacteroidetes bacterium]|nr:MAG: NADH-quinone oxidoreductase subunit L [Bacteroidota bacterium]
MDFSYTIWIPLIPFLAFFVVGILGNKKNPGLWGMVSTGAIGVSTVLSFITAYRYFFQVGKVGETYEKIIAYNTTWLNFTDTLHIDVGVLLDPISVMMLIVVSVVSLMVHIYSFGYMKGESGFSRFYAYLSLFSFSMFGLVVATNLFQMYICWELVGVSSFLLIGYYYHKPSAVAASKKAFIVTRFADLGFLIGILVVSYLTGTFDFQELTNPDGAAITQGSSIAFLGLSTMTWALILIFIGGAGKSAMFPLHIWLPDAMEGPTPVSALIHAATMVVAGVYLVARLFPLYYFAAPTALELVAIVGAFTSLFAAIIACTQTDIKRVLAFSTMSQLGYMMLALGVSGYGGHDGLGYMASMFHLFTHAMFKALLFLGAGSIIHAVHSNYLKDMGSLRKYMPITHITFLIACLAIAGIPPFAGFFSKDEILAAALHDNMIYFIVEYLVAGLTAFYMFRLYFGIFWGEDKKYEHAPHESPMSMAIPLIILAIASATVGFLPFPEWISPDGHGFEAHINWSVAGASIAIGVVGILIAMAFYRKKTDLPERATKAFGAFYNWANNKFYIDEIYLFVTKKILFKGISWPIAWFDRNVVDGTMNLIGNTTTAISARIKGMQSGKVQQYAFAFVSGVIVIVLVFAYVLGN